MRSGGNRAELPPHGSGTINVGRDLSRRNVAGAQGRGGINPALHYSIATPIESSYREAMFLLTKQPLAGVTAATGRRQYEVAASPPQDFSHDDINAARGAKIKAGHERPAIWISSFGFDSDFGDSDFGFLEPIPRFQSLPTPLPHPELSLFIHLVQGMK